MHSAQNERSAHAENIILGNDGPSLIDWSCHLLIGELTMLLFCVGHTMECVCVWCTGRGA